MSKNYKNLAIFVALLSILSLTNLIWGQQQELPIPSPPSVIQPFTNVTSARDLILVVFRWAFLILTWVAGALAVLYIIWGGINVIIQAKIDEGKQRLIYGAVGLVIALIAYALVQIINNILTTGGLGGTTQ